MLFFFTTIADKRRKVVVRDANVRHLNFADFQTLGRDTYLVPIERFNNLRKEGDSYVATSILPKKAVIQQVIETTFVEEESPICREIVAPKPRIEISNTIEISIPATKRKAVKTPSAVTISRSAITKFQGMLTPIYSSMREEVGAGIYEADKKKWIEEFGNEDLKYSNQNGYECNCGYILQRASIEFPGFEIHPEYIHDIIDTPDVDVLKFALEEALDEEQLKTIKRYRNKISLHEHPDDSMDILVVVRNYLFRCDLVISLKKLVGLVCEEIAQ